MYARRRSHLSEARRQPSVLMGALPWALMIVGVGLAFVAVGTKD